MSGLLHTTILASILHILSSMTAVLKVFDLCSARSQNFANRTHVALSFVHASNMLQLLNPQRLQSPVAVQLPSSQFQIGMLLSSMLPFPSVIIISSLIVTLLLPFAFAEPLRLPCKGSTAGSDETGALPNSRAAPPGFPDAACEVYLAGTGLSARRAVFVSLPDTE